MRLTLTKIATTVLMLTASSVALASHDYKGEFKGEVVRPAPAPCPVPCTLKDGFYVGAQVGYDSYRAKASTNATVDGVNLINASSNTSATGWVGGLLAGYGQYLSDVFYLGGEIFGNYSDANSTNSFNGASSEVRVRGSTGLAVLPGVRLNDTSLGYVRLGYNWANIDFHNRAPGVASSSNDKTVHGFNFGVGIETLMYENWSVRAEYTHTNYDSIHSSNEAASVSYDLSNNQFMLAAIYHFGC